jgi:hypothetical protein
MDPADAESDCDQCGGKKQMICSNCNGNYLQSAHCNTCERPYGNGLGYLEMTNPDGSVYWVRCTVRCNQGVQEIQCPSCTKGVVRCSLCT